MAAVLSPSEQLVVDKYLSGTPVADLGDNLYRALRKADVPRRQPAVNERGKKPPRVSSLDPLPSARRLPAYSLFRFELREMARGDSLVYHVDRPDAERDWCKFAAVHDERMASPPTILATVGRNGFGELIYIASRL